MSNQIFISYSKKDSDFANKLADDLLRTGFKIWIDRSIGGGEKWRESIESNLKASREVIVIVSPNSMSSHWVVHEGSLAYGWGKKLYPVLMTPVASLPPWLEEYQWVSFVNTPYDIAFKALTAALTPNNPMQDLLDERVKVFHQTGELFGEEMIGVIERTRGTLNISPEMDEILQKSKRVFETRRQKESEQKHALLEATKKQHITEKRSRGVIWSLITSFVLVLLVSILSLSPFATGWQKLTSFDAIKARGQTTTRYFVTMNNSDPETIFVSDNTPGGFYKSTFEEKECWSRIGSLPNANTIVTHIAASKNVVYIVSSDGMFVSSDAGVTWEALPFTAEAEGLRPTALAVNPANSLQVFAGTTPAGLFVSENGGKDWRSAAIPNVGASGVQALGQNGIDLLLATRESIWISQDNASTWTTLLEGASPIYGLSMVGDRGHFFVARGEQGIGDADVDAQEIRSLVNAPPFEFIQSVSATNIARYAADKEGIWYWRLWPWTNRNWLRAHLGIPVPCY